MNSIADNTDLDSYTRDISYDAPISLGHFGQNRHLANYSRICSDRTLPKVGLYETNSLNGAEVEEMNTFYPGNTFTIPVETDPVEGTTEGFKYSDHPLRSLNGSQPYYQVLCLDQAQDVKAQIRIFIREWDRDFDEDSIYLGRVSDVNSVSEKFMDLEDELQDGTTEWNDRDDWDDIFTDQGVFDFNSEQCMTSDEFSISTDYDYTVRGSFPWDLSED